MTDAEPLLRIDHLSIALHSGVPVIEDVSLRLQQGQILGLVGESGSGKSTLATAILGYSRPGAQITGGSVHVRGTRTTEVSQAELAALRRELVSYVPQDPMTSLNPSMRIGTHLYDRIRHRPKNEQQSLVIEALQAAELPSDKGFQRRYPHQLSGGQQQRILIAMATIARPPLVVLDEPTTGLDVLVQRRILDEIVRLRDELALTMVYVSHDLAAVASIADRVAVMYAGRIVEEGPAAEVFSQPKHPYTKGLLDAVLEFPRTRSHPGIPGSAVSIGEWPTGCTFEPRCEQKTTECLETLPALIELSADRAARCLHPLAAGSRSPDGLHLKDRPEPEVPSTAPPQKVLEIEGLHAGYRSGGITLVTAHNVSFEVTRGSCLALVGESGSGKTTIARCVVGLHEPSAGQIRLHGQPLAGNARDRDRESRRLIQIVFQNPYDSLNPRRTVLSEIERPARVLRKLSAKEARAEAVRALDLVRLPSRVRTRYPSNLSGGERQRVAIARALVANPEVLVCDEVTSSLDVSVQATVLTLLEELREQLGLAILFITHDLGVVAAATDNMMVLNRGRICERGLTEEVLAAPQEPYTKNLLASAVRLPSQSIDSVR